MAIWLADKINYIISVFLVFGILYGFIAIIKNVSRFIGKRKAEQTEYFANDLQAVIDLDTFNVNGKMMDYKKAL